MEIHEKNRNGFFSEELTSISSGDISCNELIALSPDYLHDEERFTKAAEQFTKDISVFQSNIANIPIT